MRDIAVIFLCICETAMRNRLFVKYQLRTGFCLDKKSKICSVGVIDDVHTSFPMKMKK